MRCRPEDVTGASRFEAGDRHAVYQVSYLDSRGKTEAVVVRVAFAGGASDCAEAEREASVLRTIGGTGAPLLHDFRCVSPWFDTPTMCMEHVRGHQIELRTASLDQIRALGEVVGGVHSRPFDALSDAASGPGAVASYAQERLDSILARLAWARDPLTGPAQEGLRRAGERVGRSWERWRQSASFGSGQPLALLHGDVGPGNILWTPSPVLIDWEYTRVGDPADEIAYLFDQNLLSSSLREAFWLGYRDSPSGQRLPDDVIERVKWWEPVTLLGSALWWAERWVRRAEADLRGTNDPEVPRKVTYYADHVVHRLDRLHPLLARL
jgi:aminoglycoside phosphotransferase (APT) family kinase protein